MKPNALVDLFGFTATYPGDQGRRRQGRTGQVRRSKMKRRALLGAALLPALLD